MGYGFEIDSEILLTEELSITAGISYNNTELQDDGIAVSPCGANCTVTDPLNADGLALIDGNSLPQAPEWIANFSARYVKEVGDGNFFVYTDWAYRSKINFFLYESVEFTGDPLLEGGLRVGYEWFGDSADYEVAVFSRNITNEEKLTGAIDFNNLTGYVNEARFVGIEFRSSYF